MGKLSIRDEEQPTILINNVMPAVEDEETIEVEVWIRIKERTNSNIGQLRVMVNDIKGKAKIILYYENERLKEELGVRIRYDDGIINVLKDMFGEENIKIVKK